METHDCKKKPMELLGSGNGGGMYRKSKIWIRMTQAAGTRDVKIKLKCGSGVAMGAQRRNLGTIYHKRSHSTKITPTAKAPVPQQNK